MSDSFTNRNTIAEIDGILGEKIPVLDHGFVCIVDYMGCDFDIANSARVSYGKGTKTVNQDEGLIRYLMRHRHTTPFEMCEIKLHLKMPIFIARQWMRHRTANVNEISARYSIINDEYYVPDVSRMAKQSKINNQGSGELLPENVAIETKNQINQIARHAFDEYANLIEEKELARELSRTVLPQSTYTEFFWKIDLHNLFHFLSLRADPHAQWEIQEYANKILDIVKLWTPIAYQAFCDYRTGGMLLSKPDLSEISKMIDKNLAKKYIDENKDSKKGDVRELCSKLTKILDL